MSLRDTLRDGAKLPEAFSKQFLLGKNFTVHGWREVETRNGVARLAEISLDGNTEHVEAWVTGTVIDRQLDKLAAENLLPAAVKMAWSVDVDNAYELIDVDDELNEITQTILGGPDKPKRPRA